MLSLCDRVIEIIQQKQVNTSIFIARRFLAGSMIPFMQKYYFRGIITDRTRGLREAQ
jgi:hypothetical protein